MIGGDLPATAQMPKKKPVKLLWISRAPTTTPMIRRTFQLFDTEQTFFTRESKVNLIMPVSNDIAGTAALSICESLLLALNDRKVLPEREIIGILQDAAAAHEQAADGDTEELHAAVAELINGILAGGNSVRRR